MKLVAIAKLLPTPAQRTALLATMERFNAACDWLAGEAFATRTAAPYDLHHAYYRALRERFGLSSQMAVRAIGKVSEACKRDRSIRPRFKPRGAVPYDARVLSFKAADHVSILTLDGRESMPFIAGSYHAARLGPEARRGQADLVLRKGRWYLYVTVEVSEAAPRPSAEFLGVDLGIVSLATDSDPDSEPYAGEKVEAARVRILTLRGALQRAGTPSAKRHLRRLAGREARFRADVNHTISKALVRKAQGTGRAIAMEDLRGIRDRVTVRRGQRARHGGWAFFQLRSFVAYKAALAGVELVVVDPRNTSRTCPECGHCDQRNRRSQAEFQCKSCGLAGPADKVAARNIARRAAVNRPIVPVSEAGNGDHHPSTSQRPGTSPGL